MFHAHNANTMIHIHVHVHLTNTNRPDDQPPPTEDYSGRVERVPRDQFDAAAPPRQSRPSFTATVLDRTAYAVPTGPVPRQAQPAVSAAALTARASRQPAVLTAKARIQVLGVPQVLDINGQPMNGLRAKALELVVFLAVNRSGESLNNIMEALWPDATMRRASERLSTCAANLRRVIRTAVRADPAAGRIEPILNTGGRYRLNPDVVSVDWWDLLDAVKPSARRADPAAAALPTSFAVDGGPLADGRDYEWIEPDREAVRKAQRTISQLAAPSHRENQRPNSCGC